MKYETSTLAEALFFAGKTLDVDTTGYCSDGTIKNMRERKGSLILKNATHHVVITYVEARDCYVTEYCY